MASRGAPAISQHAIERFWQRVMRRRQYAHLDECRAGDTCCECRGIKAAMAAEVPKNEAKIRQEIADRLREAAEDRSWLNDTVLREHLYATYGFDSAHRFLQHKDAVFVVRPGAGRRETLVTVLPSKSRIATRLAQHVAYVKRGGPDTLLPAPRDEAGGVRPTWDTGLPLCGRGQCVFYAGNGICRMTNTVPDRLCDPALRRLADASAAAQAVLEARADDPEAAEAAERLRGALGVKSGLAAAG